MDVLPAELLHLVMRELPIATLATTANLVNGSMRDMARYVLRDDEGMWEQRWRGAFGDFVGNHNKYLTRWSTQAKLLLKLFDLQVHERDGRVVLLRSKREANTPPFPPAVRIPLPLELATIAPGDWDSTKVLAERLDQSPRWPLPKADIEPFPPRRYDIELYVPNAPPEQWHTFLSRKYLDRIVESFQANEWRLACTGKAPPPTTAGPDARMLLRMFVLPRPRNTAGSDDESDDDTNSDGNPLVARLLYDFGVHHHLAMPVAANATSAVCIGISPRLCSNIPLIASYIADQMFAWDGNSNGGLGGWENHIYSPAPGYGSLRDAWKAARDAARAAPEPARILSCSRCRCLEYPSCMMTVCQGSWMDWTMDACSVCRHVDGSHALLHQPAQERPPILPPVAGVLFLAADGSPVQYMPTPGLYRHGNSTWIPEPQGMKNIQPAWNGYLPGHKLSIHTTRGDRHGIANPLQEEDDDNKE